MPKDLDELSSKINLRRKLSDSLQDVQSRFDPLREMYDTLLSDVVIPEEELTNLSNINDSFENHKTMLTAAEKSLEKSKVSMKRNLEQMEEYSNQVTEMRETSKQELLFKSEISLEGAFESIEKYKQLVVQMKSEEERLGKGFTTSSVPTSPNMLISPYQKDIGFLEQIWTLTGVAWAMGPSWKTGKFGELDGVEDLENVAGNYTKRVGKLGRDIKKWPVWGAMKAELDKFRDTTPLIQDLRNQALRPRHWAALQEKVGVDFNHEDPSFTLNEVVKLGLRIMPSLSETQ